MSALRRAALVAAALCISLTASVARADRSILPDPSSPPTRQQDFGPALAKLGEWLALEDVGIVWRPLRLRADWMPYRRGMWSWTSQGWFWVSDEPWGWATYHYGRWSFDDRYGWVWSPGTVWAPAWVSWIRDGQVIGWVPLPPARAKARPSAAFWTMVPTDHFIGEQAERYAISPARVPLLLLKMRGAHAPRTPPPAPPTPVSPGSERRAEGPTGTQG
jgi:hypothetical protein